LTFMSRAQSAFRHCVVTGLLAKRTGNCWCAACLNDERDLYQYRDPQTRQSATSTRQAIFNGRVGRECAGCGGSDFTKTYTRMVPVGLGPTGNPQHRVEPILDSEERIIQCCAQKLVQGQLATNRHNLELDHIALPGR